MDLGRAIPLTREAIDAEIEAIVARNNERCRIAALMSPLAKQKADISFLDDINFLVRYIMALHKLIEDVYVTQHGNKFDFDS